MKNLLIAIFLLSSPALTSAANYATCLLDKLPGVQNQAATTAAVVMCEADFPGGMAKVPQGDSRGVFASYRSGSECTLEKSRDTRFVRAVQLISSACHRIYNEPHPKAEPNFFDQFDEK
ncbi:hypothetical protein SAMN05216588_101189 [Pseudomonas flavescens]|uniref:TrbM protein n=1 Tax=Phytopseudomonas flavescens TaxID=29435 RepID=A0A1G7XLY6_9GAMM|nr:hypothetical protein [Pseudomonas flavescens]SDG85258.1 hypothetical protein SAMN05216588_101189 [Pseudomonas flavescens]